MLQCLPGHAEREIRSSCLICRGAADATRVNAIYYYTLEGFSLVEISKTYLSASSSPLGTWRCPTRFGRSARAALACSACLYILDASDELPLIEFLLESETFEPDWLQITITIGKQRRASLVVEAVAERGPAGSERSDRWSFADIFCHFLLANVPHLPWLFGEPRWECWEDL